MSSCLEKRKKVKKLFAFAKVYMTLIHVHNEFDFFVVSEILAVSLGNLKLPIEITMNDHLHASDKANINM